MPSPDPTPAPSPVSPVAPARGFPGAAQSGAASAVSPDAAGDGGRAGPVPFAVTGQPELSLGLDRTGATSFTVTNLTGRPVRVRLQPTGAHGAADSWFDVSGDREVPVAVAATVTVKVVAKVPMEVPAGSHAVMLRAVDEEDPESLVDSAEVSVTVPPAPAAPVRKVPVVPIVVAVLVVLLAAGGGAAFWFLGGKPAFAQNPSLPAEVVVGTTLTADPGAFGGRPKPTVAFEWKRCDATGCTPIPNQTTDTYTPIAADRGRTVLVSVTIANRAGSATAESNRSLVKQPPRVTTPPAISRAPTPVGEQLTTTNGVWSDAATFTVQWQRCKTGTCTPIAGQTTAAYVMQPADLGFSLSAVVTASGPDGTATATSPPVGPGVAVPALVGNPVPAATSIAAAAGFSLENVFQIAGRCVIVAAQNPNPGAVSAAGGRIFGTPTFLPGFC